MANDHITALIDRVNREPDLQSRFSAAASAEEASAIAAELGFDISTDEIIEFVSDLELDADQLEAVAGGFGFHNADVGSGGFDGDLKKFWNNFKKDLTTWG